MDALYISHTQSWWVENLLDSHKDKKSVSWATANSLHISMWGFAAIRAVSSCRSERESVADWF